jgi:hypothetical protein
MASVQRKRPAEDRQPAALSGETLRLERVSDPLRRVQENEVACAQTSLSITVGPH